MSNGLRRMLALLLAAIAAYAEALPPDVSA